MCGIRGVSIEFGSWYLNGPEWAATLAGVDPKGLHAGLPCRANNKYSEAMRRGDGS